MMEGKPMKGRWKYKIIVADHTNGRDYATVLRLSVVCAYVLWLNGAS